MKRTQSQVLLAIVAFAALPWLADPASQAQPPRKLAAKDCFKPRFKELRSIHLDVGTSRQVPTDCSSEIFNQVSKGLKIRTKERRVFHWQPTEFHHQPLYFDNQPLERYGQTRSEVLQPFISGAHFFGSFPLLPYKMGIDRYQDQIYTLGYYQSGSFAPCVRQRLPVERDALLFESGAWVALVLLIP